MQPYIILISIFVKTIKHLTMKNYFNNLLDEVKPTTDEHKDVIYTFLGFPVILFAIVGALYCILNLMR